MRTLRDYIKFCRKNGYVQEAFYYQNEIPKVLSCLGFTREQILDMSTKDVIKKLYSVMDELEGQVKELNREKKTWDVEVSVD
jgi:hypothetical protein